MSWKGDREPETTKNGEILCYTKREGKIVGDEFLLLIEKKSSSTKELMLDWYDVDQIERENNVYEKQV